MLSPLSDSHLLPLLFPYLHVSFPCPIIGRHITTPNPTPSFLFSKNIFWLLSPVIRCWLYNMGKDRPGSCPQRAFSLVAPFLSGWPGSQWLQYLASLLFTELKAGRDSFTTPFILHTHTHTHTHALRSFSVFPLFHCSAFFLINPVIF